MRERTLWTAVTVIALLLIVGGVAGAVVPNIASPTDAAAPLGETISYQGYLTDATGDPLTSTLTMVFRLYDADAGGTAVWSSGNVDVDVAEGLFNVLLDVEQADFTGQGLWLEMTVDGEVLSPRQALLAAPYALSLRPGANIVGAPDTADGAVLDVQMSGAFPSAKTIAGVAPATGTAIHGVATGGAGLYGASSATYGVWGNSNNGWGGYFSSDNGYGMRVDTNGTDHYDHGLYVTAEGGYGVYAQSSGNMAVRGEAGDVSGISQPIGLVGVAGIGQNRGVYGSSDAGSGVYGASEANYGVWGQSTTYRGVTGRTSRSDNNYGLYTPDNIFSLNTHLAGAMMQVVQNGSKETLEAGDVAVFSGIRAAATTDEPPIIQVSKASMANSPAVAGVVYSGFNIDAVMSQQDELSAGDSATEEIMLAGPIAPGGYLLLVVQGPVQVKAAAIAGEIRVGDLLATSNERGYATQAAIAAQADVETIVPGTVFGKALEAVTDGKERIYVYVTLQ